MKDTWISILPFDSRRDYSFKRIHEFYCVPGIQLDFRRKKAKFFVFKNNSYSGFFIKTNQII